jgi:hypothetical protein
LRLLSEKYHKYSGVGAPCERGASAPSLDQLILARALTGPLAARALAPESWAPKSWAPKSWAPKSWAPKSWAPESWAPESWAPESWAPESWGPESERSLLRLFELLPGAHSGARLR